MEILKRLPGFIPPPLTPPLKGEGDNGGVIFAKTLDGWRMTALPPSSPPP